jgi:hypothetical protein
MKLEDDFQNGLAAWQSGVDMTRSRSYSNSGVARPARLALFGPSLAMTDYRLEFSVLLECKGVGWVFRAADRRNYCAMRIALLTARPPYTAAIVRYPVIAGKEGPRVQSRIPLYVEPNSQCRVQVDVKGNNFTTFVQGQAVDYWSDGSLRSGGVGFFCEKGERARLLWARVSHQDDFLGRWCASLAPNHPQAGEGRRNQ